MMNTERFHIRPSQVTRTFGPGAIYDNQHDSVIIMGLNYWNPNKFKSISDEMLLQEIKKNGLKGVERLVSTSSFKEYEDPGKIPVRSFPTWGFCPRCDKLVSGRNKKTDRGMVCDSDECNDRRKNDHIPLPKTYPVRFVAACENGHLDEFPWYRWIHRTDSEIDACQPDNARLFLKNNPDSISLESKTLYCKGKNCVARSQTLSRALSKNGLKFITFGCTKKRPWLGKNSGTCDAHMRGIFKGATNIYFPLVRSAVTIPPFSDELAEKIMDLGPSISKFKKRYSEERFNEHLEIELDLQSKQSPDGKWTIKQARAKIDMIREFSDRNKDKNTHVLEFDALNSGENFNDAEFVTENLEITSSDFKNYVERIVLVKKIRVVSAITGFTRIDPLDPVDKNNLSHISEEKLAWLPVIENRGEGIFFCMNNTELEAWVSKSNVKDRFNMMMTVQNKIKTEPGNYKHSPKYVFLHTLSHMLMKSFSELAGYSTASFAERIYCDKKMAGILIYTSSPSSDGAMGGMVELGKKKEKIQGLLKNAVDQSTVCSCDPLCSMRETKKTSQLTGAACHACVLLPETCCENMNGLLDREMVSRTLRASTGFMNFKK